MSVAVAVGLFFFLAMMVVGGIYMCQKRSQNAPTKSLLKPSLTENTPDAIIQGAFTRE